jgi:hypothetical protein
MSASPDLLEMKGQFPMQFEDMEAVLPIEASLSEEQYPHICQWDDEKPAGRYHNFATLAGVRGSVDKHQGHTLRYHYLKAVGNK